MSITTAGNGRLCNQIIRNLALSILAEKFDLYVKYSSFEDINNKLGISLFVGKRHFNKTITITDSNYMKYFNEDIKIDCNFNFMMNWFQTEEITHILHAYLQSMGQMKNIIDRNPYKERYNNNNDIFLHIRLTDLKCINPGINYYINCINLLKYDNIYIGTDNFNDDLIYEIKNAFPKVIFVKRSPVETIQFGSTCKYIILSYGSFSAVIGWLGFFSNVYFPNKKVSCKHGAEGGLGMFMNKGFNPIDL